MERRDCTPVPCPAFEEMTLQVARCPACDTSQLKWHLAQRFDCADPFHNTGIANPRRIKLDTWLMGS